MNRKVRKECDEYSRMQEAAETEQTEITYGVSD